MGIWDTIKDSIKEGAKNISDEVKRRQEITQTKRQILNRYEMTDLKKICNVYGIGEPNPQRIDPISGKKYKITITRDYLINFIIGKLNLDQIENFSEKNKIKIWDIIKGESPIITNLPQQEKVKERIDEDEEKVTTIDVKRQSEFDSILESIENDFEPEDVRDENDFEKQLTQFLKYKYPNKIRRQVETPKGKLDLVIDNKYALELKLAEGKGQLRDLIGQIHSYKKVFNNVAIILLDVGKMSRSEIKEYVDDYDGLGVKTLILEGVLRRKKGKSRQIIIKG